MSPGAQPAEGKRWKREKRGGKKKEGGEQKRKKEGEAGLSEAAEKDAPVCLCKTFSRRARKGTEAANVQNTLFHFFWKTLLLRKVENVPMGTVSEEHVNSSLWSQSPEEGHIVTGYGKSFDQGPHLHTAASHLPPARPLTVQLLFTCWRKPLISPGREKLIP